jgi:hypothetical protein
MPPIKPTMNLRDPFGRCSAAGRALILFALCGHLLLRRVFAHRNLGELIGGGGISKYLFATDLLLAGAIACGACVLVHRRRTYLDNVAIGDDALRGGSAPAIGFAVLFLAYGALHAVLGFFRPQGDAYLVLRQSALAAYAVVFPLTFLHFGARVEFVRTAVWTVLLTGIACAALDAAGLLPAGWGDTSGQYPNEPPYGQMTLPLTILGLGYFLVASRSWAWRVGAMFALAVVAWRQSARLPQTVVPVSCAAAVATLVLLSALIAWKGQRATLRRAILLLAACALASALVWVIRPPSQAALQERRALSLSRYGQLLEVYAAAKQPDDPAQFMLSRRDVGRRVDDPEAYRLQATFDATKSVSEVNNIWRLLVWRRMSLDWIENAPFFGAGVGKAWFYPALYHTNFHYGDPREGLDPHNSYLNILYRYGLFGFALFATIVGCVKLDLWRALKANAAGDALLEGLILAATFTATFALFTVSLEGPSYSLPFWVSLGLLYGRARQILAPKTTPAA